MSTAKYERLASEPDPDYASEPEDASETEEDAADSRKPAAAASTARLEPTSDLRELHARLYADPRFNPPPPSPWKRIALVFLMLFLLYIGFSMRSSAARQKPEIVHASRYSKQYKFRPAASPVITEKLRDGRTRVRGAAPTQRK